MYRTDMQTDWKKSKPTVIRWIDEFRKSSLISRLKNTSNPSLLFTLTTTSSHRIPLLLVSFVMLKTPSSEYNSFSSESPNFSMADVFMHDEYRSNTLRMDGFLKKWKTRDEIVIESEEQPNQPYHCYQPTYHFLTFSTYQPTNRRTI